MAIARELALNSTGRVTSWNRTAPAKNMMPIFIRPTAPKSHSRHSQGDAQRRAQVGDGQDRVPQVERRVPVGVLDRVADLVRCHGQAS